MGKRNRGKLLHEKAFYKPSQVQKQLLKDAAELFASCIKSVPSQEEWSFFVRLYEGVEDFKRQQNAGLEVSDCVDVAADDNRISSIPPFLQWLKDNGATWNNVEPRDYGEVQGIGMVATKDIMSEDSLVRVPRAVMITHEDVSKNTYLKDLIEKNELLLQMPNVCLALFLHCELNNPSSTYKPYIDILPKTFTTTLYFTPDELKYLKGTSALSQAINHYKSIVRQFTLIYKLFNGPESVKPHVAKISEAARKTFTFDAYRWCVSAISTRQNEIPMKSHHNRKTLALIPLWDLFNHQYGPMSTDFDVKSDELESYAMKSFKKGEQVAICYGQRTHAELLIHNGFAVTFPVLPFGDGVSISLGVSPQDPLYYKKKFVLNRLEVPVSGEFTVAANISGMPTTPPLFNFLRVFHMNSDELDKWMTMSDSEMYLQSKSKILMHSQFETMCKFLENRLNLLIMVREKACGGSVDELSRDQSLPLHSRLALSYQRNEKYVLQTCIEQCQEMRIKTEGRFDKSKKSIEKDEDDVST